MCFSCVHNKVCEAVFKFSDRLFSLKYLPTFMFIDITLSILDETIESSPNMSEKNDVDRIDDFKEIFNPFGIRIIYFSLWIIYVTLSNAFFALVILYEKYGEDVMKRSINNRLWSQVALAMSEVYIWSSTFWSCNI